MNVERSTDGPTRIGLKSVSPGRAKVPQSKSHPNPQARGEALETVFEVRDRDGLARLGRITTSHGEVETPALLPVINPNQVVLSATEMRAKFGAQIVITNAYILHRTMRDRALAEGVHGVLGFDGAVMTDSGAFQQHVYGGVEVSNEEIVSFQRDIRADIGTSLDRFSEPEHGPDQARADVEETLARTRRAAELKGDMLLAGAVQGALDPDLRRQCAKELSTIDVAVHAIGGVVPLMESYRFRDLVRVIIASRQGLRPDRPVHLFGAGHPMIFALAALLGCDLFDSASYHKYARAGRMMFPDGTRHIEELSYVPCECPACVGKTPDALRRDERALAEHNLYVSFGEVARVRQAIHAGDLWELAERRCRAHPALLDALKELRRHSEWLERFEPVSRHGALFYTGAETIHRPLLARYRQRLVERYSPPRRRALVMFPEGPKPYGAHYGDAIRKVEAVCNAHFLVKSAFGPVPIELDGMYPIAQSLVPEELDLEVVEASEVFARQFIAGAGYEFGILWDGEATLRELDAWREPPVPIDWNLARVRAVADMQFGRGAADALLVGRVDIIRSRRTGRIRNVRVDGRHILSMRAHDGLFTLRAEGAKVLHRAFPKPALRVVVVTETAEFNREGRNVFAKFVVKTDPNLRPGDEVLVVDQDDRLVAVGQAFLNPEEMIAFQRGVAVHVREGLPA